MLQNKSRAISNRLFKNLGECNECGATERLHRHHCDYDKPEEIMVLCYKCHSKWHFNNKAVNGQKDSERLTCWFNMDEPDEAKLYNAIKEHAFRNRDSYIGASTYLKALARRNLKL